MVYDVTMLEAFYAAYKGKVEHVRAILCLLYTSPSPRD